MNKMELFECGHGYDPVHWPKERGCCCGYKYVAPPSRKNKPLFSGVLMYFPDALLAIAEHSNKGSSKHNPGQPLHWAKEKSTDHADCAARHLIGIGPKWNSIDDETGSLHATALAWRALALLQTVIERTKNPPANPSPSDSTDQS